MDITKLSAAERAALKAEIQQQELAEKEKREQEISTWKSLVDETVKSCFPRLIGISEKLQKNKSDIREMFRKAIELKQGIYGVKETQKSHQFMDADGQFRITLGVNVIDNYDDTVETGIQIVKDYMGTLAKDDNSRLLVGTIMRLLAKDQKGTLKASRVLQLQQMAEQCGDPDFLEGVRIIRHAYSPVDSKTYIKAEYRDENGSWVNVPLGMTEA